MGGSRPSAPVTYMPKPATPSLFISKVPESDFQAAGEFLGRTEELAKQYRQQRYQDVGTPAEIGARQAGVRSQEAASYLASLPQAVAPAAKEAATERLSAAQAEYAKALEQKDVVPEEKPFETPMWAKPAPETKTYNISRDQIIQGKIGRDEQERLQQFAAERGYGGENITKDVLGKRRVKRPEQIEQILANVESRYPEKKG